MLLDERGEPTKTFYFDLQFITDKFNVFEPLPLLCKLFLNQIVCLCVMMRYVRAPRTIIDPIDLIIETNDPIYVAFVGHHPS